LHQFAHAMRHLRRSLHPRSALAGGGVGRHSRVRALPSPGPAFRALARQRTERTRRLARLETSHAAADARVRREAARTLRYRFLKWPRTRASGAPLGALSESTDAGGSGVSVAPLTQPRRVHWPRPGLQTRSACRRWGAPAWR